MTKRQKVSYAALVVLYLLMVEILLGLPVTSRLLLLIADYDFWARYVDVIFYAVFSVAFLIVCRKQLLIWIKDFSANKKACIRDLFLAFTATILLLIITSMILKELQIGESPNEEAVNEALHSGGLPEFLSVVIFGPFAEEMVFRGFLYDRLRSRFGPHRPVVTTILVVAIAFVFMLYHCAPEDFADARILISYLPVFAEGLTMTALYARYRNLIPPFFLHMCINLIACL